RCEVRPSAEQIALLGGALPVGGVAWQAGSLVVVVLAGVQQHVLDVEGVGCRQRRVFLHGGQAGGGAGDVEAREPGIRQRGGRCRRGRRRDGCARRGGRRRGRRGGRRACEGRGRDGWQGGAAQLLGA